PVGAATDALAADAVALPVIGVAVAETGAVAAALGEGAMTGAAVPAGLVCPALTPPWPMLVPMLGPTDPGVGLADAIGDAEGVADPVGATTDVLAVDAVFGAAWAAVACEKETVPSAD